MKKLLQNRFALNSLLCSDEEGMLKQNVMLTLTSFKGVLGTEKEGMQKQNGILTLTSLNGLLGSDKEDMQNQKVSSI